MDRNRVDYNLRDTFDALEKGTSKVLDGGDVELLFRTERQQRDLIDEMTIREARGMVSRLDQELTRLILIQDAIKKTRRHLLNVVGNKNASTEEEF